MIIDDFTNHRLMKQIAEISHIEFSRKHLILDNFSNYKFEKQIAKISFDDLTGNDYQRFHQS